MRILLASSEVHPYSKSGGLADMVGAMAKALAADGHQVGIVTPLYKGIHERFHSLRKIDWVMDLPLGNELVHADVYELTPQPNLSIYFVDQPEFFNRGGLYGEGGKDYPDNAARFIFFSKAVAQLARYLPWRPQIVHTHDWQTGLVPLFILHESIWGGWGAPPRTCFTIHNLAYQGVFPRETYPLSNLPWDYYQPQGVEYFGGWSCIKAGIVYTDELTTVSQRYAREICTPEFGCGMDGLLRQRKDVLSGILNGVDYSEWNTSENPFVRFPFDAEHLGNKALNKQALQDELDLAVEPETPMFGNISRLVDQKGVDYLLPALENVLERNVQFVLLGSGDPKWENAFLDLARRHPGKVAIRIGYDHALSHRIEAATDFYVMPSRFEPCGLNQMYSLRYGSIPIVRRTGGLDDSVTDLVENAERANGIKFDAPHPEPLGKAFNKALHLYAEKPLLQHYRHNAMTADFSWSRTAKEYGRIYRRLT